MSQDNNRPFIWQGKRLDTCGQLLDAIEAIQSREEAQQFIRAYLLVNIHARANVGYLAGYCSQDEAERIYDWFEVAHPIFGRHHPDFEEAFNTGLALGEAAKERGR